jgi:hypothetical protein
MKIKEKNKIKILTRIIGGMKMGIDYYACNNCGDTFPDCGHYVSCECGQHWCSYSCAEADGYKYEEYEDEDGDMFEESTCNFCRKEDFEDYELLSFALSKLDLSRQDLIKLYSENKPK